jgi:hypothetical protein
MMMTSMPSECCLSCSCACPLVSVQANSRRNVLPGIPAKKVRRSSPIVRLYECRQSASLGRKSLSQICLMLASVKYRVVRRSRRPVSSVDGSWKSGWSACWYAFCTLGSAHTVSASLLEKGGSSTDAPLSATVAKSSCSSLSRAMASIVLARLIPALSEISYSVRSDARRSWRRFTFARCRSELVRPPPCKSLSCRKIVDLPAQGAPNSRMSILSFFGVGSGTTTANPAPGAVTNRQTWPAAMRMTKMRRVQQRPAYHAARQ